MRRAVFILVPAATPDGPVKGAYALANALADERDVTLVTLRRGPGAAARLAPAVRTHCLADSGRGGLRGQIAGYRALLRRAGGHGTTLSISMCFSADVVNGFCASEARTCASVRGNLFVNYRLDYGWRGIGLAAVHLASLRRIDTVVAMTGEMARQVRPWIGREAAVIANFVDEPPLDALRVSARPPGPQRIVFVGSLSARKRPELLVQALHALRATGIDATLDLVGRGPLEPMLRQQVHTLGLDDAVRLHGFVADPLPLVAGADLFVLPSLSEGLSRAALEALHLGVPAVLRDADGNRELVCDGHNGRLFRDDASLAGILAEELAVQRPWPRPCLVPPSMRQRHAAHALLQLLDNE